MSLLGNANEVPIDEGTSDVLARKCRFGDLETNRPDLENGAGAHASPWQSSERKILTHRPRLYRMSLRLQGLNQFEGIHTDGAISSAVDEPMTLPIAFHAAGSNANGRPSGLWQAAV
jgi:hypothetical protein